MGCGRDNVCSLPHDDWQPYPSPQRPGKLSARRDCLAQRFRQHRGNCDVMRQDLGGIPREVLVRPELGEH